VSDAAEWRSDGSQLTYSQADIPHLRERLAYIILERGAPELRRREEEEAATQLDPFTLVAVRVPRSSRVTPDAPSRLLCIVVGHRKKQFKYSLLTAAGLLLEKFSREDLHVMRDQEAGAHGFPADVGPLYNLRPQFRTLAEAASAVLQPDSHCQGRWGFVSCTCHGGDGGRCCDVSSSSCLCLELQIPCNGKCGCCASAAGCCGNACMDEEEDVDMVMVTT